LHSRKQGRRGPTPRVSTQTSKSLQDRSNTSSGKPTWLDASLNRLYSNTCGMGRIQEEFCARKDAMKYGPREKRDPGELDDFQESPPPSSKNDPSCCGVSQAKVVGGLHR